MENERSNEIKFSYQTKVSDMYRFLMHYSYHGFRGIVNLVISIGALMLLLTGMGGRSVYNQVLLILVAALFTVIQPVLLYYKAVKQVKRTSMFQQPLHYVVDKQGVTVSLKDESMLLAWDHIYKIVEANKDIYFFMSLNRAHILPKEGYINQCNLMRGLIRKYAKGIVKIKN